MHPVMSGTGQYLVNKCCWMIASNEAESTSGDERENKSQCFHDKQKGLRSLLFSPSQVLGPGLILNTDQEFSSPVPCHCIFV